MCSKIMDASFKGKIELQKKVWTIQTKLTYTYQILFLSRSEKNWTIKV